MQFGINKHELVRQVQFVVFEKITSAYLFQIAREKSRDYLIIYMKKFEMVKQKKRTRITQSGKNCAINCAIQGALNLKTKYLIGSDQTLLFISQS